MSRCNDDDGVEHEDDDAVDHDDDDDDDNDNDDDDDGDNNDIDDDDDETLHPSALRQRKEKQTHAYCTNISKILKRAES